MASTQIRMIFLVWPSWNKHYLSYELLQVVGELAETKEPTNGPDQPANGPDQSKNRTRRVTSPREMSQCSVSRIAGGDLTVVTILNKSAMSIRRVRHNF